MEEEKKEAENNEQKKQTVLTHSLKTDANKFVREKKISLTDIFLKEKTKREAKSKGKIKKSFAFILLFLILAGISYLSFTLYNKYYKKPERKVEKEENIQKSLVYSEVMNPIYIDKKEPKILIKEFLKKNGAKGNFVYAPLIKNKKSVNLNEFLANLEISAPYALLQSLENEFSFGSHAVSEIKNNPVLVLKTKNFNLTYINMVAWEKSILNDLDPIFPNSMDIVDLSAASTTVATSSEKFEFSDKIINNLDTRVLEKENQTILLYGFFAEKYLIIVNSEETFKNIINRLKISLE